MDEQKAAGAINYITDEVKALIGLKSPRFKAPLGVEPSEVRRFHQAVMDNARRYWDEEWAASSRYGGLVAPLAYPVHTVRRRPTDPDPLDTMENPDFDGLQRQLRPGLPAVNIPLKALLNGGYEYEFFRAPRVGEDIYCTSSYRNIYQRDGKTGPMVFFEIEDFYETGSGEPLLRSINTNIMR